MDSDIRVDCNCADENGLFVGRQGQVAVLVEGLHEAANELVSRTDGQRKSPRRDLALKGKHFQASIRIQGFSFQVKLPVSNKGTFLS